jgi:hypothetical protein
MFIKTPLNCFVINAGTCEAPPLGWEALCPDVTAIILSSLSLRDLAFLAPTCREMRKEFRSRIPVERARLISDGEDFLGKEMFSGFVRTFQRCMRRSVYVPVLNGRPGEKCLIINKAGEDHVAPYTPISSRPESERCIIHRPWDPNQLLKAELKCKPPGSGAFAIMEITVRKVSKGQEVQVEVRLHKGTAVAQVALLLAIFSPRSGVTPAAPRRFWGRPLNTLLLRFGGPWGVAGKADAEDLVGPLRSLAGSCLCYDRPPWGLRPGRQRGPAPPFARLVVAWDSRDRNKNP